MLFWNVQEAKIGPFHTEMWLTRPLPNQKLPLSVHKSSTHIFLQLSL